MDIFKEKIPCSNGSDVECNCLEIRVFYDLGGISWATGNELPRGYYLSVSPLLAQGCTVRYYGFSGTRMLLNEVKGQSKKGEQEALRLMAEKKEYLISRVCNAHGITLKEADNVCA